MSFMDKVKSQAEDALVKAQQGIAQGQTKLNEMQATKSHDALLRDLGSAYYAQQRSGGSAEAVQAALAALDAQPTAAAAAPQPTAAAPQPPPATSAPPPTAGSPGSASGAASGGGSFNLDDL
jgi:hypothetical protein